MSQDLLVGTRKGLFVLQPGGEGSSISGPYFPGVPVSAVMVDPRDGAWYAGLDHGHFGTKLHRSDDHGANWRELATPEYPADEGGVRTDPSGEATEAATTQLLWCLEPAHADQPNTLWCGTIPGGLFRSDDRGESWELVRSLWDRPERSEWFGGGYDRPGIHSIAIDPRGAGRIAIGVSCGGAWRTDDDCATWTLSTGMEADFMPPDRRADPRIQDPHRIVRCAADPDVLWTQHHNGIFRSIDDCRTWQRITTAPISDFGFAIAVHPDDPEKAWFLPAQADEVRIPVDGRMVLNITDDGGNSFTTVRDGLPQEHAYHLVYRHCLDVDGSGTRVAFGSTTGSLWLGEQGGTRIGQLTADLPPILCVRWS